MRSELATIKALRRIVIVLIGPYRSGSCFGGLKASCSPLPWNRPSTSPSAFLDATQFQAPEGIFQTIRQPSRQNRGVDSTVYYLSYEHPIERFLAIRYVETFVLSSGPLQNERPPDMYS
jgi:hypothetical protein